MKIGESDKYKIRAPPPMSSTRSSPLLLARDQHDDKKSRKSTPASPLTSNALALHTQRSNDGMYPLTHAPNNLSLMPFIPNEVDRGELSDDSGVEEMDKMVKIEAPTATERSVECASLCG